EFPLLFGAEIIDAKSIHRRDGDGGSDAVDRQRRSGTGTTGASGPDFGASQLQRRLAGAEHRVLEPGESFGGRISKGILAARRDRHDSGGAERCAGRYDSLPARSTREAQRKPREVANGGSRSEVLHAGSSARDLPQLSVPDFSG